MNIFDIPKVLMHVQGLRQSAHDHLSQLFLRSINTVVLFNKRASYLYYVNIYRKRARIGGRFFFQIGGHFIVLGINVSK